MKEERKNIMEKLLCPSMMCANYRNLEKEVNDLIEAGVDIFHIDIMDGQHNPNGSVFTYNQCRKKQVAIETH